MAPNVSENYASRGALNKIELLARMLFIGVAVFRCYAQSSDR